MCDSKKEGVDNEKWTVTNVFRVVIFAGVMLDGIFNDLAFFRGVFRAMVELVLAILRVVFNAQTDNYVETEKCYKCKATRTILYPICMIIRSNPKPLPKYCPVHK